MNESTPVYPSKFKGSVYNGQQRWHGDHGRFISKKLAMEMITHFMTIYSDVESPVVAPEVSDISVIPIDQESNTVSSVTTDTETETITEGAQIYDMQQWLDKRDITHSKPDGDLSNAALQVVGMSAVKWFKPPVSPNHPTSRTIEMIRRDTHSVPLISPRAMNSGDEPDIEGGPRPLTEKAHMYDEDEHRGDYTVLEREPDNPGIVHETTLAGVREEEVLNPVIVANDTTIDEIVREQGIRTEAVAVPVEKKKRGRKVLAVVIGVLAAGALWFGLSDRDADVDGKFVAATVPVTTAPTIPATPTTETPAVAVPALPSTPETSTTEPAEPDTTIVIVEVPPAVAVEPQNEPVPPTIVVINGPAEVSVPVPTQADGPIVVEVTPSDAEAAPPAIDSNQPVSAPEPSTVVPATFDSADWPYANAVNVGAESPGIFVQRVLDEYNLRAQRGFVWNHRDGMFYEGRHIINRAELNTYYDIFNELHGQDIKGLPVTA